jgi:methylenetetrahydrofolate--tRNA-(uracil-5-)-methyltransferase
MSDNALHIIGGGMAGSEAAWQAAELGQQVVIHEMRPKIGTFAHQTGHLAEMVCSNSFRSDDHEQNAVGLLHWEMRAAKGPHYGNGLSPPPARRGRIGGGS